MSPTFSNWSSGDCLILSLSPTFLSPPLTFTLPTHSLLNDDLLLQVAPHWNECCLQVGDTDGGGERGKWGCWPKSVRAPIAWPQWKPMRGYTQPNRGWRPWAWMEMWWPGAWDSQSQSLRTCARYGVPLRFPPFDNSQLVHLLCRWWVLRHSPGEDEGEGQPPWHLGQDRIHFQILSVSSASTLGKASEGLLPLVWTRKAKNMRWQKFGSYQWLKVHTWNFFVGDVQSDGRYCGSLYATRQWECV